MCQLSHSDSAMSLAGMGGKVWGESSSECGSDDSARPGEGHARQQPRSRRMQHVATALVAGGIALAIKAHAGGSVGGSSRRVQQRRHQRRQVMSHRLAEVPEVDDE
jgi:hypothetical protein